MREPHLQLSLLEGSSLRVFIPQHLLLALAQQSGFQGSDKALRNRNVRTDRGRRAGVQWRREREGYG